MTSSRTQPSTSRGRRSARWSPATLSTTGSPVNRARGGRGRDPVGDEPPPPRSRTPRRAATLPRRHRRPRTPVAHRGNLAGHPEHRTRRGLRRGRHRRPPPGPRHPQLAPHSGSDRPPSCNGTDRPSGHVRHVSTHHRDHRSGHTETDHYRPAGPFEARAKKTRMFQLTWPMRRS